MKNNILVPVLFLFLSPFIVNAQSEEGSQQNPTLRSQFQEMLEKSETYTEYKVIKRTSLSQYSRAVQDSLNARKTEINSLKSTVADQKSQIGTLSSRITELEAQLEKSEALRGSLTFLGLNLNKATYHTIVWVIIIALAAFGVFAYTSFVRSNKITSNTKKEYKSLEVEYEEHKKKSHEKQIKMGRELQTERNMVEELKTKLKAKSPGKP
ncbi:MAG: hypothetical protein MI975_13940 [Cytophagales bacterium]|nr:hypothetical protein [Cytophagales bacterium]